MRAFGYIFCWILASFDVRSFSLPESSEMHTCVDSVQRDPGLFMPCSRQLKTNDVNTKGFESTAKKKTMLGCDCEGFINVWDQFDKETIDHLNQCDCGWRLSDGRCEERRCPWGQAYFASNATCVGVDHRSSKLFCKPGQKIYVDPRSGHAECDCFEDYIYWPANDRCYAAYTRGPCPEAMMLLLSDESQAPRCVPNSCLRDGLMGSYGWCYNRNPDSTLTLNSKPPPGRNAHKGELCSQECTAVVDSKTKGVLCFRNESLLEDRIPYAAACLAGSYSKWKGLC